MLTQTEAAKNSFVRDRIAWLSYVMIATYCYAAAALGPMVTFLRAELDLNYTVSACHFGFWSSGVVTAGLIGDRCMKYFGKQKTVWVATLCLCIGITILICGRQPAVTITGAFICGLSGSTMAQTMCTILADHFAALRAVAITEANIAASLCCSLAPLAVSIFSKTEFGWRAALLVPIVAFGIYFLVARKTLEQVSMDDADKKKQDADSAKLPLPKAYWLCWALIFFSVASEWSIMFWTADFLEKVINLSRADAAACVTSFLFAMVLGRILGSRLAREISTALLLRIASILSILGFSIFWSSKLVDLCLLGLFLTGLGVSNFYPLTLSLAIASAPGRTSLATSRMSLASGGATLSAPLLLGLIAERNGILVAYGLIAGLLLCCSLMIFHPIWSSKK